MFISYQKNAVDLDVIRGIQSTQYIPFHFYIIFSLVVQVQSFLVTKRSKIHVILQGIARRGKRKDCRRWTNWKLSHWSWILSGRRSQLVTRHSWIRGKGRRTAHGYSWRGARGVEQRAVRVTAFEPHGEGCHTRRELPRHARPCVSMIKLNDLEATSKILISGTLTTWHH